MPLPGSRCSLASNLYTPPSLACNPPSPLGSALNALSCRLFKHFSRSRNKDYNFISISCFSACYAHKQNAAAAAVVSSATCHAPQKWAPLVCKCMCVCMFVCVLFTQGLRFKMDLFDWQQADLSTSTHTEQIHPSLSPSLSVSPSMWHLCSTACHAEHMSYTLNAI